mmetsp:Transcript_23370/g.68632  ORF Transcript_23370/g.68632 Transcript_23370/m.68632 type:complete len:206 (-) Transcript_23370:571-1188(-)
MNESSGAPACEAQSRTRNGTVRACAGTPIVQRELAGREPRARWRALRSFARADRAPSRSGAHLRCASSCGCACAPRLGHAQPSACARVPAAFTSSCGAAGGGAGRCRRASPRTRSSRAARTRRAPREAPPAGQRSRASAHRQNRTASPTVAADRPPATPCAGRAPRRPCCKSASARPARGRRRRPPSTRRSIAQSRTSPGCGGSQ